MVIDIGPGVQPLGISQIIDGTGKTLMPGMIDAHGHVFRFNELREALVFGVTTVLGMFDDAGVVATVQAQGPATDRADLRSTVNLATPTGGHPTQFGFVIPTIDSPSDAMAFVDARIAEGAELLKIVLDDYSIFGPLAGPVPSATVGLVSKLVKSAHKRGLKAVGHVTQVDDAEKFIQTGGDGLAHMPLDRVIGTPFIQVALARDAFIVPTLGISAGADGFVLGTDPLQDPLLSPWISPFATAALQFPFPPGFNTDWEFLTACESVWEANHAGIPLLAGTDAAGPGVAHGVSVHRELELLVHCGLTPVEALQAATANAAHYFGLPDRGTVEIGKLADMLLVNGDPTADVLAARDIDSIWRRGERIDRLAVFQQALPF